MNYAVILAGGVGQRAGGNLPKQFQKICGVPMFLWSVKAFREFDPQCGIMVVLQSGFYKEHVRDNFQKLNLLCPDCVWVEGGGSRIESVKNGLTALNKIVNSDISKRDTEDAHDEVKVFIHDAARPLVTRQIIESAASVVERGFGAIPTVPVTDSLRRREGKGTISVPRAEYMAVQTPQVFILEDIVGAYGSVVGEEGLTDDASVAERYGIAIKTVEGEPTNIKVTNPLDFLVCEVFMRKIHNLDAN